MSGRAVAGKRFAYSSCVLHPLASISEIFFNSELDQPTAGPIVIAVSLRGEQDRES